MKMVPGTENMTDITKLKQNHMECIDAVVKVLLKNIKNLEAIIKTLNDKVGALEANEIELKEHIDMLILKLKCSDADVDPRKLEINCGSDVEHKQIMRKHTRKTHKSLFAINVNIFALENQK